MGKAHIVLCGGSLRCWHAAAVHSSCPSSPAAPPHTPLSVKAVLLSYGQLGKSKNLGFTVTVVVVPGNGHVAVVASRPST